MRRYRLLAGLHIGANADGQEVVFKAGDVVETSQNLLAFNGRNMAPKFELIDDVTNDNARLLERIRELEAQLLAEREARELATA